MSYIKGSNEVNIHIIHSMKGGCGKSTCALFKAIQTAFNQDIDDEKAHVLFADADFKGSAMTEILFHRDGVYKFNEISNLGKGKGVHHELAIPDNFNNYITLSDYLRDSSKYSITDIICHSCSYETESKEADEKGTEGTEEGQEDFTSLKQEKNINGYIDFILSSVSSESKDWFRYMEGKIPAGVYRWRMDTVIRNVLKMGTVNDEGIGTYTDIVIDMPPGYDEYSDILLELLRGIAEEEENVKLHYYAVTTQDTGHNVLARDNIAKMIKADSKYKPFASVNLILSAVSSEDFGNLTNIERTVYGSWLKADGKINGEVYENKYSKSFHEFCRMGNIRDFEQDISKVLESNMV